MNKILLILFSFVCSNGLAQDVIVKKDGSTILSKVLEVNTSDIKYKKYSNLDGPTYTILKAELLSINYKNGEKDMFDVTATTQEAKLTESLADKRNVELLNLYNKQYVPTDKVKHKNSFASSFVLIFGIKPTSIMSNRDIEMNFVREIFKNPHNGYMDYTVYYIVLKNKTDKTIYVDRGNCFRISNGGDAFCYYGDSEQTTINMGGGTGATLALGSVANVFGVRGIVGKIADGINAGGGSTHSVSKTYMMQRIIAIPPHGSRKLTEEKYIKTRNGSVIKGASYEKVEAAETFNFAGIKSKELGLEKGMVKKGDVLTFSNNLSPWKRDYYITYSFDENFKIYSYIKAEVFLHQLIGLSGFASDSPDGSSSGHHERYIEGYNEYTIEGFHWLY